jgi:hypothetical protein
MPDLIDHFNDEEFSDVILTMDRSTTVPKRQRTEERMTLFLSKAVLAQSEYFRTLLSRRWTMELNEDDASMMRAISIEVEDEDDEEVLLVLLRLMYGMPASEVTDLVQMAKVYAKADKLVLHAKFLDALDEHLIRSIVSKASFQELFDLYECGQVRLRPETYAVLRRSMWKLYEQPKSLQTVMMNHLQKVFGNVPMVIASEDLCKEFCSIPFKAVAMWLILKQNLSVHSENCIMYMVSAWVAARRRFTSIPSEELRWLADHVVMHLLSPMYLTGIVRQLDWYKANCSNFEDSIAQSIMWKMTSQPQTNQLRTILDQRTTFEWDVERACLPMNERMSETKYINGIFLRAGLSWKKTELWIRLHVDRERMSPVLRPQTHMLRSIVDFSLHVKSGEIQRDMEVPSTTINFIQPVTLAHIIALDCLDHERLSVRMQLTMR